MASNSITPAVQITIDALAAQANVLQLAVNAVAAQIVVLKAAIENQAILSFEPAK
jgi:hypothetical protein